MARRSADGGQVAEEGVAVAAQAVDALPEPFGLALEQLRGLRGQALRGQIESTPKLGPPGRE
jgi:hypothetical protein